MGEYLLVLTVSGLSCPAGATSYPIANKELTVVPQQQLCCPNHRARFGAKKPKCHSKFVKHVGKHLVWVEPEELAEYIDSANRGGLRHNS